MSTSRRPFSPRERKALADAARGPHGFKDDALAYLVTLVLASLILGLAVRLFRLPAAWGEFAQRGALLLALLGPWYVRRDLARLSTRFGNLPALREDLQGGEVEEVLYDAVDAIRVEETGDLGSNYYIRLEDGRVVFLSGQYLYQLEDAQRFPSTRFTLVRTPRAKYFLDLVVSGRYLPPSTVRPPFTDRDYRSGVVPANGDVLRVDFETLRHDRGD